MRAQIFELSAPAQGSEPQNEIAIDPSGEFLIVAVGKTAQGTRSALALKLPISASEAGDLPTRAIARVRKGGAEGQIEIKIVGAKACVERLTRAFETQASDVSVAVAVITAPSLAIWSFDTGKLRVQAVPPPRRTRVLIVDDSAPVRKLLTAVLSEDPELEVVGAIELPRMAEEAIERLKPDVMTLDIYMPEMNGVELLKRTLAKRVLPTVMISSLSLEEGGLVLDALEAGAVDYVQKPSMSELAIIAPIIREKIRNAAKAKVIRGGAPRRAPGSTQSASGVLSFDRIDSTSLIAIGASTGGTEALKWVLTSWPQKTPPILIVQHIPAVFSKAFADRMNQLCAMEVREAVDGDVVEPSVCLIAPGGKQMKVRQTRDGLRVVIDDSSPVNRHKPSVDVLFDSLAETTGLKISAGILTGMGADGARGLLKLRQAGARTLAQDEATSVVYGMPREAAKIGGAEEIVPISAVAETFARFSARSRSNRAG